MKENLESKIAKQFNMTDEIWMLHANPWSVYTRFSIIPIFTTTIWFRTELGYWVWVIIIALAIWTWYNPRVFPKVKNTQNWASRGVFGERVWINRKNIDIPEHHKIMPNILNGIAIIGLPFLVYGLYIFNFWMTILGVILMMLGKTWFVDRMVCLYEDMKHHKEYGKWEIK